MDTKKIVVIGGSAAGPKAAARARRLAPDASITIIQKGSDLSMASCGYPYYVGKTFDRREELISTPTGVIRDPKFFANAKGIDALVNTQATSIDPAARTVTCRKTDAKETVELPYDKLIIATGATPVMPPLPGINLQGVTTLQSMEDADFLRRAVDENAVKNAVVVGGGLIGVETCEALQENGVAVTLIELLPQILGFLDWEMARIVENHVRAKGVSVITENGVQAFTGRDGKLQGVTLSDGTECECGLAVVAVGVRPNTSLAEEAGLRIGETGGIDVNEYMQTSDENIYAAGDCVQVPDRITGKKTLAPYGDLANLQGRVAGENAVLGNRANFPGTVHTGICKVFDFSAASTGLSERKAADAGMAFDTVIKAGPDVPHFMKGKLLVTKMLADKETGRLLGVQCVGPGDVSRQTAEAAMAVQGAMTIQDLVTADLPYAPPFSPAIDNLIATAHVLENKRNGLFQGVSCAQVKEKADSGQALFLLDVRGPDEFEAMRLGIGEKLIPLGALRERLDELPENKGQEIICYCKVSLRGYEAARLLTGRGWTNVKVMEGGVMAWPFERQK